MSLNHNSQEYNSVFNADNSNIFNNGSNQIFQEGKERFINATSLDEKYQTIQNIHLLMIKEFKNHKDNINIDNFSNWLQEVCNDAAQTANQYIDVVAYGHYVKYVMFVFHFWNGVATWLHSKNNRENKLPVEYPYFAGNMDCCKYYSEKILVYEHQQTLYQQFLYHTLTRDANVRASFEKSKHRNEAWRHNPLNYA